jgi:hypothetical protein
MWRDSVKTKGLQGCVKWITLRYVWGLSMSDKPIDIKSPVSDVLDNPNVAVPLVGSGRPSFVFC